MRHYILDTNVILDSPNSIQKLQDNDTNKVAIPYSVILELDRIKGQPAKNHLVSAAVQTILDNYESINIIKRKNFEYIIDHCNDTTILDDICYYRVLYPSDELIFVTNDKLLQLRALQEDLNEVTDFHDSRAFLSESEIYTGIIKDGEEYIENSFNWKEGKLYYNDKLIDYENEIWKLKPRTIYQNMLMELLLDERLDVITVQSQAGYGKSMLCLGAALQLVLQKKQDDPPAEFEEMPKKRGRKKKINENKIKSKYEKIFILKPTITIGKFLPINK